jgi:AcrR family transcriptional regulator
MARTKQRSDEALLDAAMPALFAKGPGEFTLGDVARAVGLSPATLVQRFGSKQGLVLAALEFTNRRNFAALDRLPPDKGAAAVIRIFVDRTPGPEHEHLLNDQLLWLRESMADGRINALTRDYFEKFRQAIADRMPQLSIPAGHAVLLLEAQWHGSLIQWGIGREGHLREFVERNLRDWFVAVGAPPDP